jgi:hypothetical protein
VIRNLERGRPVFVASMALRRHKITRGRMLRLLLGYPPMTIATLARIYANALRLKLRGARFHPHPEVRADEQAVRVPELPGRRRGGHVAEAPGFETTTRQQDDGGATVHAELRLGDAVVMVAPADEPYETPKLYGSSTGHMLRGTALVPTAASYVSRSSTNADA